MTARKNGYWQGDRIQHIELKARKLAGQFFSFESKSGSKSLSKSKSGAFIIITVLIAFDPDPDFDLDNAHLQCQMVVALRAAIYPGSGFPYAYAI
jgi:hypothetical protein